MSRYRRQLRRHLAQHQAQQLLQERWDRRVLTGATVTRLDDDGRPTDDVRRLNGDQAQQLLDDAEIDD